MFIDYYIILEVEPTCSQDELKKAYRTLAKKWHPDLNKNKDAGERMRQIIEAYTLLSDDEARYRYDLEYSRFNAFRKSKEESKQEPDNKKETKSEPSYEQEYEIKDEILKEWMTTAKKQANQFFKDLYGEIVKTGKNIAFGIKEGVISAIVLIVIVNIIYFTVQTIDPINNDSSYEGNDEVLEELNNVSRESRNPIIDKGNILKDFSKFIRPRLTNRKLKTNVIFGDLNGDGVDDAVVDYCIEATDEDRDVGGGNALMSLECMESGFAVYVKSGNSFYLKKDRDKSYFADEGFDYKAERIQNGKIFCTNDSYEDDDPRCCPSQKGSIYLVYENGELIKPAQIRLITTNESTDVRIESEVDLPNKLNYSGEYLIGSYSLIKEAWGDINRDGLTDFVVVVNPNLKSKLQMNSDDENNDTLDMNDKIIAIYIGTKAGGYTKTLQNNNFIMKPLGFFAEEPFTDIKIDNLGNLIVSHNIFYNIGSWETSSHKHKFRFNTSNSLQLISYNTLVFNRSGNHEFKEHKFDFISKVCTTVSGDDFNESEEQSIIEVYQPFLMKNMGEALSNEINGVAF